MFTVEQIKNAHSKVQSGADFPAYIQEIKELGVQSYETFLRDGHTVYSGLNNYQTSSPARYEPMTIAADCQAEPFKKALKEHQQGKSDYNTFIRLSADFGIHKWAVDMDKMTCTYYDLSGGAVLVEIIPSVC